MKAYKNINLTNNSIWYKLGGFVLIIVAVIGTMALSFSSKLKPSEYVKWVSNEANGLLKTKKIGEVAVKVQYKPISYIIANEERTNDLTKKQYNQRAQELENMQYYNLVLDITDARNILNYQVNDVGHQQERIHYLSFGMQEDIYLIEDGKELPCKLFHFERTYDISKERTFLVAFEQDPSAKNKDKTFVLDSPVFNTGPIKIKFKASDLKKTPQIKLK